MQRTHAGTVAWSDVWRTGALGIGLAVLANLVVLAIVRAIYDVADEFLPLGWGAIGFFTFLGTLLGLLVYAALLRWHRQPLRMFNIIAWAALVLSLIPNIVMALNPASTPFPNASGTDFFILIIFHLVAGIIFIGVINRGAAQGRS